jgi:hypothetical protein
MSISRTVRSILALACMGALPLYGQYSTQTTGTTSTTQKVTKRPVAKKTEAPAQTSTTGTTATTTTTTTEQKTTKKTAHARGKAGGGSRTRVWADVTRLSAILIDTQNQKVDIPADAWQKTANEANALANRIAMNAGGQKAARELRTHIHEMHSAAMSGDADGARAHAAKALPYAFQLIDWSAPPDMRNKAM